MSTVWFMVDDTDPRLQYTGSWSAMNTRSLEFDEMSTTGPVYNNTLHHTTGNVTLSFRFNGSSYLGVYGTQDGNIPNGRLPDIGCTLDGATTWTFGNIYPQGHTNNNKLACRADSIFGGSSPGEHELLINVTNFENSDWYFDYITFESLANPALNGEVLQAGNADLIHASNYSMLTFGPGWNFDTDDTTITTIPGSNATVKFQGKALSLYGDLGNVSNTATYQIDDQDPVTFQLPAIIPSKGNQLLFAADNLSIGEHTVAVVFDGSQTGAPLDIGYFYVTSLTAAEQASPLTSPSAPSSPSASSSHLNTRTVVGVAIGAVTAILLLLLHAMILMRRRRQRTRPAVTPFNGLLDGKNPGPGVGPLPSKILFNSMIITPSSSSEPSAQANSSGSGNSTGALANLKLQQRLAVLQAEISQRDRRLAEGTLQQERVITVHTDSGLRLTGEDAYNDIVEVPPNYTAL